MCTAAWAGSMSRTGSRSSTCIAGVEVVLRRIARALFGAVAKLDGGSVPYCPNAAAGAFLRLEERTLESGLAHLVRRDQTGDAAAQHHRLHALSCIGREIRHGGRRGH